MVHFTFIYLLLDTIVEQTIGKEGISFMKVHLTFKTNVSIIFFPRPVLFFKDKKKMAVSPKIIDRARYHFWVKKSANPMTILVVKGNSTPKSSKV